MYGLYGQSQQSTSKLSKLESILNQSSYSNKSDIKKACEELLKNFDTLDCFSAPNPGKQSARVVEIHGTIPVNFKGTFYHLMMRIVQEIVQTFGAEYPLYEATSSTTLFKSSLYYQQQQQSKNNMIGQNTQNVSAQNVTTNISNNWGSSTMTTNMNMMGTNQNTRDQLLAQVRKKYSEEALVLAKKLEKDLNTQRNSMVELQNLTLKLQDEEAKLQKFEETAPVIISDLEEKIQGLDQIISIQQGTVLNSDTLRTTIEEVDDVSKMLMDLITTNKSMEDLNIFAEELFNAGKIDLETYLKIYKDNVEREFMNNVWIRKLISASGSN